MSKTKTLNARVSHFSGRSRVPCPPLFLDQTEAGTSLSQGLDDPIPLPLPPRPPLSEGLASATALFGKIFCCHRKSNLVNLDQNANVANRRRCSL